MSTAGKVIIVTGASRGIGLAATHYLLNHHCNVVAAARSNEPLEKLRNDYPEQVQLLAGDLTDFSLGQKAVNLAKSKWGRLDGLIINHGVLNPVTRIRDVEAEEWKQCFNINVFSAVAMIKAALPTLSQSQGRIVLTSSGAAVNAYAAWGAYGASKAALNHLALTLAVEEPEVTTIALRPGVVDTEMQRELREIHHTAMDKDDATKFASLKREGKLLRPDQPGHVIAKLVLDAPKELNGKFLNWNDKELAGFQES